MSPSRKFWTPHDGLSHSFHVLRGSCSCDRTRWFVLHYRSPCSKRCDPPQDGIATWNVPMTSDIETATKERLSFNNLFTTLHKTVVCEHTMLWSRLQHDVNFNDMAWRVSLPPTQASTPSACSVTSITKTSVSSDEPVLCNYVPVLQFLSYLCVTMSRSSGLMDVWRFVFCFLIDVWINSKIYLNVSELIMKYLQNLCTRQGQNF